MQLQKELRTHKLPKDSTHVCYSHTKYELQTPTGSGRTRIHVFFWVFSTILEMVYKGNPKLVSKFTCESGNFGHKNHRKDTVIFSRRNYRIIPNKFLRGASAMKLRHMQHWFDRSPVNMFPEPVFTLDFSRKMSICCSNPTGPNHIQVKPNVS